MKKLYREFQQPGSPTQPSPKLWCNPEQADKMCRMTTLFKMRRRIVMLRYSPVCSHLLPPTPRWPRSAHSFWELLSHIPVLCNMIMSYWAQCCKIMKQWSLITRQRQMYNLHGYWIMAFYICWHHVISFSKKFVKCIFQTFYFGTFYVRFSRHLNIYILYEDWCYIMIIWIYVEFRPLRDRSGCISQITSQKVHVWRGRSHPEIKIYSKTEELVHGWQAIFFIVGTGEKVQSQKLTLGYLSLPSAILPPFSSSWASASRIPMYRSLQLHSQSEHFILTKQPQYFPGPTYRSEAHHKTRKTLPEAQRTQRIESLLSCWLNWICIHFR